MSAPPSIDCEYVMVPLPQAILFFNSFLPSATPNLGHLMSIYVGQLNIVQSIGTSYPTLGIPLLEDHNGVLVDALRSEHQHNVEAITRAIFQRWITGTGRKPTTWRTLVDVLRECKLAAQADAIDAYFGTYRSISKCSVGMGVHVMGG